MTESIISNERSCYLCGTTLNLERHHVYGGYRRKNSEKYGCVIYLCSKHHRTGKGSVHRNREVDLAIKQRCQEEWEARFGNREDFIRVFGRNYL